jgi:hypothetical protein
VLLPSARAAAAWFVETAHAAMAAGTRLDPASARLLIALAPDDPLLANAIENVEAETGNRGPETGNREPETGYAEPDTLVTHARAASDALRRAVDTRDEALARAAVTILEEHVLRVYRPAHGLGSFEEDIAVAGAMLDAYEIGQDETHLMMAEELMLTVLRRYWKDRGRWAIAANCEAAVVLGRLAEQTEKSEYRDRAIEALEPFAETYRSYGLGAAPFVSALHVIR